MLDAQVGDLLHAGACVVEQEEEGAITQGVSSMGGQPSQERLDFVALQEERLRGRRTLDGDRGHLLRHRQILRTSTREKLEEGAQYRQAVIPRPPMIVSRRLEILEEPEDAIEREGLAGNLRQPTRHVARDEHEKEAKAVSVRFDGRRPQPSLDRELVGEKGLNQRAH
jgi:hypothetical protein